MSSRKPRPSQREPGWWSRGLRRVQERFWTWRQSRQARSERGVLDPDSAFPEQRFTAGLELPTGALQQSWLDDPNTGTGRSLATEHWTLEQALTPQRVEERRQAPAEEEPSDAAWEEENGESEEEELEEEELAEEDQLLEEFEESEEELAEDGEEAFEEDLEELVEDSELDVEVKDTSASPRSPLEFSGESPPASPATPVPHQADSKTSPPVSCSSPLSPLEVPAQLSTTPSHFGAASPAKEEDAERLKVKLQRLEMELAAMWQQIEDDKKATEACHLEALQFMSQGDCLAEGLAAERERLRELSGSKQAKQHDDDCRYWADAPFLAFREVSPCDVAAELRRLQAFVEAQDVQVLRLEGQLTRRRRAADAVIRKLSAAREHVLSQRRQTTELQEALKEVSAGPFLEAGLGDGALHLEPSSTPLFAPTGRKRPTLLLPAPTPAVCRSQLRA